MMCIVIFLSKDELGLDYTIAKSLNNSVSVFQIAVKNLNQMDCSYITIPARTSAGTKM